jgi:rhodanese-related sulfurtransferase
MPNIPRITPAQAKKLMDEEGYIYLDVRTQPEYVAGHPKGARNVPLMHSGWGGMQDNNEFMEVMTANFPKDAKIIVGCKSGQRSAKAAEILAAAGYTNLVDQRAGFEGTRNSYGSVTEPGWGTLELPSETETPGGSYPELKLKAGRRF